MTCSGARRLLAAATMAVLLLGLLLAAAVPAHASSAAAARQLYDALDADRDGVIGRDDWDASAAKVAAALGVDLLDNFEDGAAGGRNMAAAARRRDGLSGENLVPRKQLGSTGGKAFNPADGGPPARSSNSGNSNDPKKKLSFTKGFTAGVAMIVATEIGDKTFFIAAVLSMRNDRRAVFGGAILALVVMTVLSTLMGLVLPSLLPRRYTHVIGGLLFLYFGIKLVLDSRSMEDDKVSDELEEVEEELLQTKNKKDEDGGDTTDDDIVAIGSAGSSDVEGGESVGGRQGRKKPAPRSASGLAGATAYRSTSFQSIFVQSLTLTFLAEWGDRSQIATIALAAAKDPVGVTVGGCLGHSMCTGLAVVGGRMLAARISEKTVSFYGGIIFTVFGVHSLFFES